MFEITNKRVKLWLELARKWNTVLGKIIFASICEANRTYKKVSEIV